MLIPHFVRWNNQSDCVQCLVDTIGPLLFQLRERIDVISISDISAVSGRMCRKENGVSTKKESSPSPPLSNPVSLDETDRHFT